MTAVNQLAFSVPSKHVTERSTVIVTVKFLDRTSGLVTPTNAKYRIDDISSGAQIADWTALTPASSNSITVTSTQNAILNNTRNVERKQMTVAADYGLSTEYRETAVWTVENVAGTI